MVLSGGSVGGGGDAQKEHYHDLSSRKPTRQFLSHSPTYSDSFHKAAFLVKCLTLVPLPGSSPRQVFDISASAWLKPSQSEKIRTESQEPEPFTPQNPLHKWVVLNVLVEEGPLGIHFLKGHLLTQKGNLHSGHFGDRYIEQLPRPLR